MKSSWLWDLINNIISLTHLYLESMKVAGKTWQRSRRTYMPALIYNPDIISQGIKSIWFYLHPITWTCLTQESIVSLQFWLWRVFWSCSDGSVANKWFLVLLPWKNHVWSVFTDFRPLTQVSRNYLFFGGEGSVGYKYHWPPYWRGYTYLTIILRNRAEYWLILSRLGLWPRRLKSDDIPQDWAG